MVDEAIDHGRGHRRIPEHLAPSGRGSLSSTTSATRTIPARRARYAWAALSYRQRGGDNWHGSGFHHRLSKHGPSFLRVLWRKSPLGRRLAGYKALRLLRPNVQLSYFKERLGNLTIASTIQLIGSA